MEYLHVLRYIRYIIGGFYMKGKQVDDQHIQLQMSNEEASSLLEELTSLITDKGIRISEYEELDGLFYILNEHRFSPKK